MTFDAELQRYYNTRVSDDLVTYKVLILLDFPKLIQFVKKTKPNQNKRDIICKFSLQNIKHVGYQQIRLPVKWFKTP